MNDDKRIDNLLKSIDNIDLVPDDELEKMDFYELSYYMQTLNNIEALAQDGENNNG